MDEHVKQITWQMAGQKERLIKNAISHVIGNDNWTIKDIAGRGMIKILPDKTEIFAFDGIDLLHFFHMETTVESGIGVKLKVTQSYKQLYR